MQVLYPNFAAQYLIFTFLILLQPYYFPQRIIAIYFRYISPVSIQIMPIMALKLTQECFNISAGKCTAVTNLKQKHDQRCSSRVESLAPCRY